MSRKVPDGKKDLTKALLETGKNFREIAEALDISIASVHRIAKEPREDIAALVLEIKGRLSAKCYLLADHILNRMSEMNIMQATLKEKAIAAAILTDKATLMEKGAATTDTETLKKS